MSTTQRSILLLAQVYGTCIMDYGDLGRGPARLKAFARPSLQGPAFRPPFQLLGEPPFDTPLNTTMYFLGSMHYEKWRDHFSKKELAGRSSSGALVRWTRSTLYRRVLSDCMISMAGPRYPCAHALKYGAKESFVIGRKTQL